MVNIQNGSIKYIFEKNAFTGRIARWQMLLSEYDIQYVNQKAIKGNALADYLAHQPVEDYQLMQPEFPILTTLSSQYKVKRRNNDPLVLIQGQFKNQSSQPFRFNTR